MRSKSYPLSNLTLLEDEDILYVEYCRGLEINLHNAKEIVANRFEFMQDAEHYMIIDATNIKSVSPEARSYLLDLNYGTKNILASAIIASNPVSALLANIFIKSSKNFPSRFFSKKVDALKWIKELKVK